MPRRKEAAPDPLPYKAVVIDDADGLRELVRCVLEASGRFGEIHEARDGREGLDLVSRHRPDLVLLDISMPRMDGLETLQRMRRIEPFPTVVMLSGFRESAMGEKALGLGAAAYIEKGASPDEIVATVLDRLAVGSEAAAARARGAPWRGRTQRADSLV